MTESSTSTSTEKLAKKKGEKRKAEESGKAEEVKGGRLTLYATISIDQPPSETLTFDEVGQRPGVHIFHEDVNAHLCEGKREGQEGKLRCRSLEGF